MPKPDRAKWHFSTSGSEPVRYQDEPTPFGLVPNISGLCCVYRDFSERTGTFSTFYSQSEAGASEASDLMIGNFLNRQKVMKIHAAVSIQYSHRKVK